MSSYEKGATKAVRFGDFQYNFDLNTLSKNSEPVSLQNKPSELLALLLQHKGVVVTRDEIIKNLWGQQVVDFDQNINFIIKSIRKALGDTHKYPQYIQTIPRKGYRFIADVKPITLTTPIKNKTRFRNYKATTLAITFFLMLMVSLTFFSSMTAMPKNSAYQQELKRAQYLLDKNDLTSINKSTELFHQIIASYTESADAYAGLAVATILTAGTESKRNLAMNYAKRSLAIDPNSSQVKLANGMAELHINWNLDEAYEFLSEATEINPQLPRAWYVLSIIQTIQGDHDDAHNSINKALIINPGRVQEIFHSGWIFLSSGDYVLALQQCSNSVEINPSHVYSHLCIVDAATELKLHQKALQHMTAYMEILETPKEIINQITLTEPDQRLHAFYNWRIELLIEYSVDQYQMALGYAKAGQNQLAINALQNAIDENNIMVPCALADFAFRHIRNTPKFKNIMNQVSQAGWARPITQVLK